MTSHYSRGQEQDVQRALQLLDRIAGSLESIAASLDGLTNTQQILATATSTGVAILNSMSGFQDADELNFRTAFVDVQLPDEQEKA